MGAFKDLSGMKFHRLTVISRSGYSSCGRILWMCKCDCGTELAVIGAHLRSGNTKSCGCYDRQRRLERNTTHGMTGTREYRSWYHMKERCYLVANKDYHHYGGRGIKVCDEWRDSFESFYRDMGTCPSPKHSIDRIDVNGNYCKDNCRWASVRTQRFNIRMKSNNTTGHTGIFLTANGKWMARIGKEHLGTFADKNEAILARKQAFEKESHNFSP